MTLLRMLSLVAHDFDIQRLTYNPMCSEDALTEAIKDNKSVVVMFGATWSQVTVESKKAFER